MNEDDGNLNFEKGKPFANVVKATVDAEIKWRNFGFFGRGTAFYDFDLHDSDKLGPTGQDRLGKDVVGLDGFFFAQLRAVRQEPARARRPPGDQLGREHLHPQRHQRDQPGGPLEAAHPGLGAEGSVHPDHGHLGAACELTKSADGRGLLPHQLGQGAASTRAARTSPTTTSPPTTPTA